MFIFPGCMIKGQLLIERVHNQDDYNFGWGFTEGDFIIMFFNQQSYVFIFFNLRV